MALCKNCFHREVCEHLATWTTISLDDIPPEIPCSHFKDTADVEPMAEWISVEERLPDNGETVLTVDNEGYMIVASWYELGGWFLPVCRANPVTHWMHLPEPPRGEA